MHTDNKKKDILILDKGPTQELDDITLTAEAQYLINFLRSNIIFCFSLRFNECVYDFSIDYKTFDTSNIIDIHKNLMETHDLK